MDNSSENSNSFIDLYCILKLFEIIFYSLAQKENEQQGNEDEMDEVNQQNERHNENIPNELPNIGRYPVDFFSFSGENNNENDNTNKCFEANLNGIYTNISKMINIEKKKIQKEKEYIQKSSKEFNDYKSQELIKLEKEKTSLRDKYKLNKFAKENDIIDLNIGGTHFITTKRSTLLKVSFLIIILKIV